LKEAKRARFKKAKTILEIFWIRKNHDKDHIIWQTTQYHKIKIIATREVALLHQCVQILLT
jgi:hypothetical protein